MSSHTLNYTVSTKMHKLTNINNQNYKLVGFGLIGVGAMLITYGIFNMIKMVRKSKATAKTVQLLNTYKSNFEIITHSIMDITIYNEFLKVKLDNFTLTFKKLKAEQKDLPLKISKILQNYEFSIIYYYTKRLKKKIDELSKTLTEINDLNKELGIIENKDDLELLNLAIKRIADGNACIKQMNSFLIQLQ